jgi:hypothetical protein
MTEQERQLIEEIRRRADAFNLQNDPTQIGRLVWARDVKLLLWALDEAESKNAS